ncbi:nucleoside deaminase, partial [Streptomyces lavendulae]
FVQRTIDIARRNVAEGGRPFATVIVKNGEILAESPNKVDQTGDPTAHAEVLAIREACVKLRTEHLTGTTIFVLAHPCPMCLGALYYCSPDEVVFLATRDAYECHRGGGRKVSPAMQLRAWKDGSSMRDQTEISHVTVPSPARPPRDESRFSD